MPQADLPLNDGFNEPYGRFQNYDAIPANQRGQLFKQKHVDIRSFRQDPVTTQISMLSLDLFQMNGLDALQMSDMDGQVVVRRGEEWTNGVVGAQPDRNNWNGITLTCAAGTNLTQSVIRN